MVWVVQYQNHGGWDWDTPLVVPPAAWDCLTLPSPSPSARLVLSRSISSVECRTDGSSPRCCSSCCSSDVGAAGVPVVIRPIPGPTTETTDTHVPASPYRRRMCYVCGTAWPRSMYRATRFPCAIPTTVEAMATSQKHYPPREGTGRKKHLARLPNVYLYPGRPRDSILTSTRERTGRYTTCPISTCPVCPPQADADSPPMCRSAERLQDPVAWPESRALQDEQQTNGSWHSIGIVACGIFSTVASGGNKQQDSMRNIGSPTWVRQGLFVCEQTRCYALIPAWCPIFSAQ